MYFLVAGIILVVMKLMEVSFVAQWSWWGVLSPFALAVAWWAVADATGYTKRKVAEAEEKRIRDRVERHREALGMKPRRR